MDKYEIIQKIENFAPPETQESWDSSGWLVETSKKDVKNIMLCLTVTENVFRQAENCDMIISHHPLFSVPTVWKNKDIYCAHTNFDKASGGTTDCLIEHIFPNCTINTPHPGPLPSGEEEDNSTAFLRYVDINISVSDLTEKLRKISPNLRYVNNKNVKELKRIAFCAGSGSEFIIEAYENGADAFVTGDVKFHTALESPLVFFDIGHFESEIISLKVFEKLIGKEVKIFRAKEQSPFIY